MSCTEKPHTNRAYRYYYQVGSMENPYEGEARGFDDEWAAVQYMDENMEHAQVWANELGDTIVIQVLDMHSFGKDRVVSIEYVRPAFTGHTTRPALAAKQAKKVSGQ